MAQVSVIIATHSRPHLLPRAVESARFAGNDVEIVVVDDASTDQTVRVCRELPGIKYVRLDRNQRVAGARNVGILASTGSYITFLDDDDVRLPGSLDRQVATLEKAPDAGLVYGKAFVGNALGEPGDIVAPDRCAEGDLFWALLEECFIHPSTAVFRRSSIYRVGLLDASIPGIDDWDLWVRIAELYPIVAVQEPVSIWRMFTPDSDQATTRIAELLTLVSRVQQPKWMKLPRAANALPKLRSRAKQKLLDRNSDLLIWNAAHFLPSGFRAHARKGLLTALRLNPVRAIRPWTMLLLFQTFLSGSGNRKGSEDRELHTESASKKKAWDETRKGERGLAVDE